MGASLIEERAKRRLSGILSDDAVRYNRLSGEYKAVTVQTFKSNREVMVYRISPSPG